jgi:hypothetical protein
LPFRSLAEVSVEHPHELKEFWIKEKLKLARFIQDNEEIHSYHHSGATHPDKDYFLSEKKHGTATRSRP